MTFRIACVSALALSSLSATAGTTVLQAFEGDGFDDWKVKGDAFGLAPIAATCEGLTSPLTGYADGSAACSAHDGDDSTGTLESPPFRVTENFLAFLIAGGHHPGEAAVQLLVDGKVDREATGSNNLQLKPVVWDVSALKGKQVAIRIIDTKKGSWGMIAADHFILTDNEKPSFPPTTKVLRPGDLVPSENVAGLTIPQNTKATVVADFKNRHITSPTALAFGDDGNIYVAETHRFRHGVADNRSHLYWYLDDISSRTTDDRRKLHEKWQNKEAITSLKFLTEKSDMVRLLSQPDAKGVFQKDQEFAGGFNDLLDGPAAGVFEYEGTVYLSCIPKLYALKDTNGDGVAEKRDVIQDGFGVRISFSGHDMNGFALGMDGRLYGTIGDRGFNIVTREGRKYELPDEGAVFRFDPDGSNFEVIHTGLRNPKEIAFNEFGDGISVDNNSDQGDKARVVYVVDGGDSGWNMGHQGLMVHHRQEGMEEKPPARWMAERIWELENNEQPAYTLPPVAHITSGPSGLTYHPGTGFLQSEAGHFLICDYKGGAASSGIWSFKVEPKGATLKMSESHKLNWGAAVTDVEYSWDGKLAITDFIGGWESHDDGRVYTITADKPYRASEAAQTAQWIKEGFEKRPVAELAAMLRHPDQRVRLRAELALTRRPEAIATFTAAAKQKTNLLERLHGVWGLGVVARRGGAVLPSGPTKPADANQRQQARAALLPLLGDADAEVRAQTIKTLGECDLGPQGIPFDKLFADSSDRVKLFTTIAAGRTHALTTVAQILAMVNETEDRYLRNTGAYALSLLAPPEKIAELRSNASSKVRMVAVIALRRSKSPELVKFLTDADPAVSNEAIRSINDQDIASVRPQIAALLDGNASKNWTTMLWRRALHSAFRAGDEANARRVVKVALNPATPAESRKEALRLLGTWTHPFPVDQSTGRMAPLPDRNPEIIRKVLGDSADALATIDGSLLEAALAAIVQNKVDPAKVSDANLLGLVRNNKLPGEARVQALELYEVRKPADLASLLASLATSDNDELAIAALHRLVKSDPPAALAGISKAATDGKAHREQEAWKLAGELNAPGTTALFVSQLEDLQKHNGVSPAALELLDAAGKRNEAEVKSALAAFKAAQSASTDPLAAYLPALEGGNASKGGDIFESHPAGQCMRCHSSGHGGGDAGPNLSGVGNRGDRRYFLESLVNPSAKVASGYGMAAATLKGGKSVSGVVIEDNDDHVDFDSSGKVLRVMKTDLDTMTPPMSAMPPMVSLLAPGEMRDVIAWLSEQKSKDKQEKKRPAPERVTP